MFTDGRLLLELIGSVQKWSERIQRLRKSIPGSATLVQVCEFFPSQCFYSSDEEVEDRKWLKSTRNVENLSLECSYGILTLSGVLGPLRQWDQTCPTPVF